MSRSWTVDLPHADAPLTPNRRKHWRVYQRAVKTIRQGARDAIAYTRPAIPELDRAHLELRVTPPTRHRRDTDNWVPYLLKPVKDAVVDAGVLVDDTPAHCTWAVTAVEPDGSRRWRYQLVISELVAAGSA